MRIFVAARRCAKSSKRIFRRGRAVFAACAISRLGTPIRPLANPLTAAPRGLLLDPAYRAGVAQLGALGLSYDAWLFFPQLSRTVRSREVQSGGADHHQSLRRRRAHRELRGQAQGSVRRLVPFHACSCPVAERHVKVGGLGMRINGFDFDKGERPPSSMELAGAWEPWMHTCIDAFGADRCMFESNFPVDKGSYPYSNGWNAFKRLTTHASAEVA